MIRARAAVAVAAMTLAGAAGLAVAPAMATEGSTPSDAVQVSQPTATNYSFTLSIAGAGIQINYVIDTTGQVTSASIGAVDNTQATDPTVTSSLPVNTSVSCATPDPTAPQVPASPNTLSCSGKELTLTLNDGTVVKVELGDGGTSVEEVHASGPSVPTESATPGTHEQSETSEPSKESEKSGSEHEGQWSGQTSTGSHDGSSSDENNTQSTTTQSGSTDLGTWTVNTSDGGSGGSGSGHDD